MTSPSRQAGTAGLQSVAGASAASFVPSKPTASASLKTLVAIYYLEASGAITMPTGFANVVDLAATATSGAFARMRIDWKIADGSEGATLTWSWSGAQWRQGLLFCIDNAQTTGTPTELSASSSNNGAALATVPTNVALTGNATVDDFVLLASFDAGNGVSDSWAAAATWALEQGVAHDDMACQSIAQVSGGAPATSRVTLTSGGNNTVGSVIVAVKSPAAAQDTPELYGRPDGLKGHRQMHQLLAQ